MGPRSRIVTGTRWTEHYDATARISPKTGGMTGLHSGLLALCSIMVGGPSYPFSVQPTGQPTVQKELPKSARLTMVAPKITSFTSPSLLIGLPLRPVQNTRNPSSQKFSGETNRNEGLELANLVKIPRLSSDENRRIRFGELR